MKKTFTILIAAIAAILMMTLPGKAVGQTRTDDSYTIVFANSANNATAIAESTGAATTIASGSRKYVESTPYSDISGNCYYGGGTDGEKASIRVGKSGNNASITIALSESDGQVTATSIVVNCMRMTGNKNEGATLSVNGMNAQAAPNAADNLTYTFGSNTDIESIELTTVKAVFIYSITVNYTTGGGQQTVATPSITGTDNKDYFVSTTNITLACETSGASIQYKLNNAEDWTDYSVPFEISSTTTVYAKATKTGMTESTANKLFTKLSTITDARAQAQNSKVYTQGTITSVRGKDAFIQDDDAAICVRGDANLTQNVGDNIRVYGTLGNYGGLLQIQSPVIEVVSTGNTVVPTVMTIAEVNASSNQGWFVKIVGATVGTTDNNNNTTLTQNANSIVARNLSGASQGDVINLTGNISVYNSTKQIANPLVVVSPTLEAAPESLSFAYISGGSATVKTLTISGDNLDDDITITLGGTNYDKFAISEDNSDWSKSVLTIDKDDAVGEIYVRLNPSITTTGIYNAIITLSSTNATDVVVNLAGTITGQTYEIVQYSTVATAHGEITFSPGSQIEEGSVVTLIPTPNEGYSFVANSWKFYNEDEDNVTNSISFVPGEANQIYMPSYDLFVDATFGLKPTYDITTSVNPHGSGTIETDANAWEGKTVTVLVEANSGYMFDNIVVSKKEDSNTTIETSGNVNDGFTFEMPGYAVTVTATFDAVYSISFIANGTEKEQRIINQGSALGALPSLAAGDIPTGFEFKGWTTLNEYYNATEAPAAANMISAETIPSANTTYSAVFAQPYVADVATGELTGDEIATYFSNMVYSDDPTDYEDSSDKITWTVKGMNGTGKHRIQIRNNATPSYIEIEASSNIISVDLTISNASNLSGGDDDITKHGYFTGTINLNTSIDGDSDGSTNCSSNTSNAVSVEASGNYSKLYIQVTAAARIWNVSVNYGTIAYKNFTTIVTDEDISGDVTGETRIFSEIAATASFTNNGTIHIYDGGVLNMGSYMLTNSDDTKLIIEDGGQLVINSSHTGDKAVAATFKKSTIASTAKATNKWYAISSPVGNIDIDDFAQGGNDGHNVYRYDEPTRYWNEYRSNVEEEPYLEPFTELVSGRGYLYRSTVANIEFVGDVNVGDATYKLKYTNKGDDMNGFNLIGNPFSYNIYKGVEIPNTDLEPNFYVLEANGGWTLSYDHGTLDPTAITPNTAILVQAQDDANDKNLTISKSSKGGDYKYGNDQISFRIENSEYSDVACVLFREGHGLNKISHRNAEIPMLYVTKEGENFASANMPDNTSVINLGFEAKTMGQYTFSLKTEGQYSYMHLYDKLTGEDVDMLLEDSYTFIGSPSDRKDRFVLNLNYNAAGIDTESDIFAYQSGNDIIVSGEGELQVFDVMGRMVATQTVNGVQTVSGLNNGVYIFRMGGKTQKIVVR